MGLDKLTETQHTLARDRKRHTEGWWDGARATLVCKLTNGERERSPTHQKQQAPWTAGEEVCRGAEALRQQGQQSARERGSAGQSINSFLMTLI